MRFDGETLLRTADLSEFTQAAINIKRDAIISPVLRYGGGLETRDIWLKVESLQPLGSFKIRAAANLLVSRSESLENRIATASAGNFAQGLALVARRLGLSLTVHVPDNASPAKISALKCLGAHLRVHRFDCWWSIMTTRETGAEDGLFVHPVREREVIIGNGTAALELIDQLSDFDTIVVPYGGGGLAAGLALALRASGRCIKIVAAEVETAAPLSAAFAAGRPVAIDRKPSFIDGIGSVRVIDEMWPLVRDLVDEVVVATIPEVEEAIRMAMRHNALVVEGAAGAALAVALSERVQGNRIVCILSGGNIAPLEYARLLHTSD